MTKIIVFILVAIGACLAVLINRHGFAGGIAAAKQFVTDEWHKLFTSATLWLSYLMMAWPTIVNNLQGDLKWLDFVPAAWHDKSIAVLGGLVWAARMRTVLPPKPTAPPGK